MVAFLLGEVGLTLDDLDKFYAAGAFGTHLNLESAVTIGMYPDLDRNKFNCPGNTSLEGAYKLLTNRTLLSSVDDIANRVNYIGLENAKDFLEKMRKTNSEMKSQLIKEYQNLNICENGTTVSIMMVTHKNKDIDLEKEFAKLKIGVISCASFESVDKNSVRFRLPSPKYLSRIIEAFNIIDNLK